MAKPRAFISFDFDRDRGLKDMLAGQAKLPNSPFEFSNWAVSEAISGDWEKEVRTRIKKTDLMFVICGTRTDLAAGVDVEVKIAQEEGIPYFLLRGHKNRVCKKPKAAKSDQFHSWTWESLEALVNRAQ